MGETAYVQCFVDNTNCLETVKCLELIFKRLFSDKERGIIDEDIIFSKQKFAGMLKGQSGVIDLECPITLKTVEIFDELEN